MLRFFKDRESRYKEKEQMSQTKTKSLEKKHLNNLTKSNMKEMENEQSEGFIFLMRELELISSSHYVNIIPSQQNDQKIYCSLTTIPPRIMHNDFFEVLDRLTSQTLNPTKIFISIAEKFMREFIYDEKDVIERIKIIEERYPIIQCIRPKDYGPSTKLLGLLEWNEVNSLLNPEDIIIIVDDDILYKNHLIEQHMTAHCLYGCDCCAVDQRKVESWIPFRFADSKYIYGDEYDGNLYGWMGFSMKYGSAMGMMKHYEEIIGLVPESIYHDDAIFTSYCWVNGLYCVESTQFPVLGRTSIDQIDCLRFSKISNSDVRKQIEHEIRMKIKKNNIVYKIPEKIGRRFIQNVNNVEIEVKNEYHISTHYVDHTHFLMTVSLFNDDIIGKLLLTKITVCEKVRFLTFLMSGSKQTFLVRVNHMYKLIKPSSETNKDDKFVLLRPIERLEQSKFLKIMQTSKSDIVTKKKFYSVQSILANAPDYEYCFYDDQKAKKFIDNEYEKVVGIAYDSLIPGAYKADLFRYCWLYVNGGIYFDCKMILFINLHSLVARSNELYVKDLPKNYCYNAMMICRKSNEVMRLAINQTVKNTIKCDKTKDTLSLTGPGLLGDVIDSVYNKDSPYKYCYFKKNPNNNFFIARINDQDGKTVVICTYNGYYKEDNYQHTNHYGKLWENNTVFKYDKETYLLDDMWKFEGIAH